MESLEMPGMEPGEHKEEVFEATKFNQLVDAVEMFVEYARLGVWE